MSKFFQGLLDNSGLFEKEAAKAPQPTPKADVVSAPAPIPGINLNLGTQTPLALGTTTLGVMNVTGQLDENLRGLLLQALTDANLASPNYLDFKGSLEKTGAILSGLPEEKIFQTVFSTLSTAGATVPKLDQSAQAYLNILATEQSEFVHSMDTRTAKEITGRQDQIDALQADSEEKTKKIQELTEAIQKNQTDAATLQSEKILEANKIEVASKNFDVTYQLIVTQINEDLSKIDKYLISATS